MKAWLWVVAVLCSAPAWAEDAGVPVAKVRFDGAGSSSEVEAFLAGLRRANLDASADARVTEPDYVVEGRFAPRAGKTAFELTVRADKRVVWSKQGRVPSPGAELLGQQAGEAIAADWRAEQSRERHLDLVVEDATYEQLRLVAAALASLPEVVEHQMWRFENGVAEYDLKTRGVRHAGKLALKLETLEERGHRFQLTRVTETTLRLRVVPVAPPTDAGLPAPLEQTP